MSRGEEKEQQQQQREAAQCRGGGAAAVPPPRRWLDEEAPTTARWRCRSCAAVAIGDCVALGCCPCAVVSLLGLALVKAPLVVGRRCVGRLKMRRRVLLRKKRVRDLVAASKAACIPDKGDKEAKAETSPPGEGGRKKAAADATSEATAAASEPAPSEAEAAEMAWLEEMFRVGHWGFGRVSVSGWEDPVTYGASVR